MKRIISFLLVICISFVSVLLTACGNNENHEHTYKTEWSYDDTHHWHDCNGENCNDIADKAIHAYSNDNSTCSVCGYKKVDETNDVLTEAEWQTAFDEQNFKNVTLNIEQNLNGTNLEYSKSVMQSKVTDKVIFEDYEHYNDSNELVKSFEKLAFGVEADDSLMLYAGGGDGNFDKADGYPDITFAEYYTEYINGLPKHIVNLKALYSKFEFNKQELCYIACEPIVQTVDLGEGQTHSVEYTVFKVWFSDGKLAKIYVECEEMEATLTYTDYGSTVVEIPEAIKNELGQSSVFQSIKNACEHFSDYSGDITISLTQSQTEENQTVSSSDVLSYNSDTKEAFYYMQYQDGYLLNTLTYVGENYYLYKEMQQGTEIIVGREMLGALAVEGLDPINDSIYDIIDGIALAESLEDYISTHQNVLSELLRDDDDEYANISFNAEIYESNGIQTLAITLNRSCLGYDVDVEEMMKGEEEKVEIYYISTTEAQINVEIQNGMVVGFDCNLTNTDSPITDDSSLKTIDEERLSVTLMQSNIEYSFAQTQFDSFGTRPTTSDTSIAGAVLLPLSNFGDVFVVVNDREYYYNWQGDSVDEAYQSLLSGINDESFGLSYATVEKLYLDKSCTIELDPQNLTPSEWLEIEKVYVQNSDLNYATVDAGTAVVSVKTTSCSRSATVEGKDFQMTNPICAMFGFISTSVHSSMSGDGAIDLTEQQTYQFNTDDLANADEIYVNGEKTTATSITLESGKVYIVEFVTYK